MVLGLVKLQSRAIPIYNNSNYMLMCSCCFFCTYGTERLKILVLGFGIEAGTVFVNLRQVAVTKDQGIGEVSLQTGEHRVQGAFLCRGAGVGVTAFLIQSALVADSNAVGIVVPGMGAGYLLAPAGVDEPVAGDVVVVADTVKATGFVAGIEVLYCEILVAACCTAVYDYQIDSSHIYSVLEFVLDRSSLCSSA